jgi:hypothetical protein
MAGDTDLRRNAQTNHSLCVACCNAAAEPADTQRLTRPTARPLPSASRGRRFVVHGIAPLNTAFCRICGQTQTGTQYFFHSLARDAVALSGVIHKFASA